MQLVFMPLEIEILLDEVLPQKCPHRSVNTAQVLLMCALGEICDHRDRVPDLLLDEPLESTISEENIIPGLAQFEIGTEMLNGGSLGHVRANILASLYLAQLGMVGESHGYLSRACSCIQALLPEYRNQRPFCLLD
jgi:hypothetical protein